MLTELNFFCLRHDFGFDIYLFRWRILYATLSVLRPVIDKDSINCQEMCISQIQQVMGASNLKKAQRKCNERNNYLPSSVGLICQHNELLHVKFMIKSTQRIFISVGL